MVYASPPYFLLQFAIHTNSLSAADGVADLASSDDNRGRLCFRT